MFYSMIIHLPLHSRFATCTGDEKPWPRFHSQRHVYLRPRIRVDLHLHVERNLFGGLGRCPGDVYRRSQRRPFVRRCGRQHRYRAGMPSHSCEVNPRVSLLGWSGNKGNCERWGTTLSLLFCKRLSVPIILGLGRGESKCWRSFT